MNVTSNTGEAPVPPSGNGRFPRGKGFTALHFLPPRVRRILVCFVAALFLVGVASVGWAQEADAAPKTNEMSFLIWLAHVSGIIGLFILILSIYFVAIVVKNFLELRMSVAAPEDVQATVNTMIEQKNYRELQGLLAQDGSFYSETLGVGIGELRYGLDEARNRMDLHTDTQVSRMERGIANMAVIGTLGPMIGLLGTLKGMIGAFSEIAISGVSLDASKVAHAISEALVLTFEGVLLSIPATFFYSYFRNKIQQIKSETMEVADAQLKEISMGLRKQQPGRDPSTDAPRSMG